jgi:hypothetical protein
MANPCKVTIKTSPSAAPKEMSYEDYMEMLYNGGLEKFIADGTINTNKIPGDNPFEAKTPPQAGPTKRRGFVKSVEDNDDIPDNVKAAFSEDRVNYDVLPNDLSVAAANGIIDSVGIDEAEKIALTGSKNMPTAFRITLAQVLIKRFSASGETQRAVELVESIAELATDFGQAIQALSLFARLTPEGAVLAVTRQIKKSREKALKKYKADAQELKNELNSINKKAASDVAKIVEKEVEKTTATVRTVKRPAAYGSKNKLVTKDKYEKAKQALKGKMFSAVAPPPELVEVAMFHIEAGARNFADFAQRMVEDFGDKVSEYLQSSYDAATDRLNSEAKQKEIDKNVKKFGSMMSEQLPRQVDRRSKIEKLQEMADAIDAATGNDAFNQILNDYKAILAQEQLDNDAAKAQKKLDKLVAYMATEAGVKKGLKEMNVKISDLIKKHYSEIEATKEDLINKFINEAGLSGTEADALANKVQAEFEKIVKERKESAIKRYMPRKGEPSKKKEAFEKLVEASNLGAVTEAMVNDALAESLGIEGLSAEDAKNIQDLANKVQEAGTEREELRAVQDLLTYQENMKGFSWFDATQAVWMASILSGWKTQTINAIANLYNTAALFMNASVQKNTSRRMLAKGLAVGWKRGFFEGLDTLKTGYSPIRDKSETPTILERTKFKGGKFNPLNYAKYVRRLMTAVDVVAFEGLRQMRSFQMAYKKAAAENEGMSRKDLRDKTLEILNRNDERKDKVIKQAEKERKEREAELNQQLANGEITKEEFKEQMDFARTDERFRIHELLEQGRPEEIMQEAKDYAARGTFNYQPTGLLGMLSTHMNSASRDFPPLKFVIPFVNVISNVANETLNYTPVGFARGAREGGTISGLKPQRDWNTQHRTELMIKATMGTALMGTVYLLTKLNDDDDEPILEITTNGFGDYRKNKELAETGWQQYSLRVKNPITGEYSAWMSYKTTPFMVGLSYIGALNDADKYRGEDISENGYAKAGFASTALMRSFLDQTFLSSGEDFLSAMFDERDENLLDNVGKSLMKTASGILLPNFYTQTAQKISEIMDIPQKDIKDTYLGRMLRDVPVAKDKYNNMINAFGDEVTYDTDLMFSTEKGKPEDKLWKLVISKKQTIGTSVAPETYVDKDDNEVQVTDEQAYQFSKIRGSYIKRALEQNYDELSKMDNEKFSKYLQSLKTEATNLAKTSFSVTEDRLNKKIEKELRSQKSQIKDILRKDK